MGLIGPRDGPCFRRARTAQLFRQTNLLAESFHSRIAAKEGEFGKRERSADAERPSSGQIQCCEGPVLVAEPGIDQSVIEWIDRACLRRHSLCILTATGEIPRLSVNGLERGIRRDIEEILPLSQCHT